MSSEGLKESGTGHVENVMESKDATVPAAHDERPVWETREAYGKQGFMGMFNNRYVTACAAFAALGGSLFGYDQGVVSVTLVMDQFLDVFPEINNGLKKGILTSMVELGAFVGSMNMGWISDKFSRKRAIFIACIIFLAGSAIQTGARDYNMLVGGRLLGGIGVGMLAMVVPIYISEIAPPEMRGTLLVLQELSIVFAIVVAFYITYGTRYIKSEWAWRLPFLLQMIPAILLAVGINFLPYSPRWLALKGRDEESLKTLSKLRGLPATDERVLTEWFEIRAEAQYRKEVTAELHPKLQDGSRFSRFKLHIYDYLDCFRKSVWRRTMVGIMLMFFQQFVGINALIYYSPTLFGTMGLDYQMQLDMSGVLNVCQLVACIWSLWGMDRFGRRPLLLFGSAGCGIAHLIIACLTGKFENSWATHKAEGWVSTAFLFVFMLVFGASWGPIGWALPAEIFPASLRSKGVAYSTMSNWLNNFIIGLITPPLVENTGFGAYVFFCVFCILAFLWTWFFVPETNGRTLEQMDHVFKDNTGEAEAARKFRIEQEIAASVWQNGRSGEPLRTEA